VYKLETDKNTGINSTHLLCACVLLLTGVGLVTLYSSSYAFAQRFYENSYHFIRRQSVFGLVGIVLFFICTRLDLEKIRVLITPLVILAVVLCLLTLVPGIGVERNSASRWIKIGSATTYQPSELVKLALPMYLAHRLDKKKDSIEMNNSGIVLPVLITGIFFILIYLQNNFSTAIFIAFNALAVFFLAGLRLRYFFAAIIMMLPVSALLVFTKEHRVRRLLSFVKPEWDPLGAGYQVRSSLLAIISGGFLGKGIGQGTRKIASVPEIQSDFIFCAFAEETGFIGVLFFFILFSIFIIQGYRGAWRSSSVYKSLLAYGLVTMLASQALLNIAVVSGALPATGVPLPFFSSGGSALITTLVSAGFIVNVARNSGKKENVNNIDYGQSYDYFNSLENQDVR